jgi:hypothetical protein
MAREGNAMFLIPPPPAAEADDWGDLIVPALPPLPRTAPAGTSWIAPAPSAVDDGAELAEPVIPIIRKRRRAKRAEGA